MPSTFQDMNNMSTPNEKLIEKADFDLAALGASVVPIEVQDKFVQDVIDASVILPIARTIKMKGPQLGIDKIGFGTRISHAATEGTELNEADYAVPSTDRVTLNTKECIAVAPLTYDVIENNIEGGNVNFSGPNSVAQPVTGGIKDTVMNMMTGQIAVDIEELMLLGNTASGDSFLALTDGILKIAEASGHVVDVSNAAISKAMFKAGRKMLPVKYQRSLPTLRQMISPNQDLDYRDTLANRDTAGGDRYTEDFSGVYAMGVPVMTVPLMPEASGIFTHPQNLIVGIQRGISIEVLKQPLKRRFLIIATYKVDFQIQEPDAIVFYKNIGV
jgi:hypothetical protein